MEATNKKEKAEYFTFPVALLMDGFSNIKTVCDHIIDYSVYAHFSKLEKGTELERLRASLNYFEVIYKNEMNGLKKAETLFNSLLSGLPMSNVSIKTVWQYFNEEKTEFEIACFLAFAALKSIIGTKPYAKTTNDFLIARMGGFASKSNIHELLPEPLAAYNTRRKLDKIKLELRVNWNVNIYAYRTRGFYVSIDQKFSLDKLALEAEKKRIKFIEKQQQIKINEARNKALKQLYN